MSVEQIKLGYIDTTVRTTDETFLSALRAGRLPWEAMRPFPEPSSDYLHDGDSVVAEIDAVFRAHISGQELETTGTFPEALVEAIRVRGYSRLRQPEEMGGFDLDAYTLLRVIQQLATWSMAAANTLAITNTVGPNAILRVLEPGPLRDYLIERISAGVICAFGDSGPDGQNNRFSSLTATLTDDGTAYILNGRKLFTGNAPIAELIAVSATTEIDGQRAVVFPFLDTSSPGFRVHSEIEFIGYKGFPDGEMRFDNVRVPAEQVLTEVEQPERLRTLTPVAVEARIFNIVSMALALGRRCAEWSREFVNRRWIDDRPLGQYEEIQRIVSLNLAELFATETIAQWTLRSASADILFEQIAAKTLAARLAWRIADRTVTLLGGEGVETAASKERRGAQPIPAEQYLRDARILRTTANVDFQIDNQAGQILLARFYSGTPFTDPAPRRDDAGLSSANQRLLAATADWFTELSERCVEIVTAHPDPKELFAHEHLVILVSRIAAELFTATAVLARSVGHSETQLLAEVYVSDAMHRVADLMARLDAESGIATPDYAALSDTWLTGSDLDFLLRV
ncbi:acyl-CoA dehydrogenase family protein [Nocardia sp. NPDC059091]|uniref:acyl-CoA dehydrogenase family protein n=1 Tax=unclassified Nocardia TaxID=2637762 RepID=UPI00368860F0